VLTSLIGTPYVPNFDGAILFLEDVDEGPYRIDRMLTQLALAGVLGRVAGVVFGQCTRCTDGGSMLGGFTVSEVLEQHLTPLRIPAFEGILVGHIPDQLTIPVGVRAEIDAAAGTIRMLESAVA
jgi:muramoyltetrapeptide carboxypeptidase